MPNQTEFARLLSEAKIYESEGLIEEAKKVLHSLLSKDPENIAAKKRLKALDKQATQTSKHSFTDSPTKTPPALHSLQQHEELLEMIDKEFGEKELNELKNVNEKFKDIKNLTPQEHHQMGVGFLSMELYELALKQFQYSSKGAERVGKTDLIFSSECFMAICYIHLSQCFKATEILEKWVLNADIELYQRTEAQYLMGLSYEKNTQVDQAKKWYKLVTDVDPNYRDAKERLSGLDG